MLFPIDYVKNGRCDSNLPRCGKRKRAAMGCPMRPASTGLGPRLRRFETGANAAECGRKAGASTDQDCCSVGAASACAFAALRFNASSSPMRTRWRFFMRLPLRGVANQTWRRRTFQIARLLSA